MTGAPDLSADELAPILAFVSRASGIDFTAYKVATLHRRVVHRMGLVGLATATEYRARLVADPGEVTSLLDALLIKTTAMFREPSTFALLRDRALPELFARRAAEEATMIRAWVAGCATGEEAFSIAMCLREAGERFPQLAPSVLASDVDRGALERLARGTIAASSVQVTSPALDRWLAPEGDHYRVDDSVRAIVTGAHHDVVTSELESPATATLASFDLVACRNLLIYLERPAQRRVIARLVRSCAPGALLVLGEAEAPADAIDGLEVIEPGLPVYRATS